MNIFRRTPEADPRTAAERKIDTDYDEMIRRVLGQEALDADMPYVPSADYVTIIDDGSDLGFIPEQSDAFVLSPEEQTDLMDLAIRRSYEQIPYDPSES